MDSLRKKAMATVKTLNSLEGIQCHEIAGSIYAFPRLLLPDKAIEEAKVSMSWCIVPMACVLYGWIDGWASGRRDGLMDASIKWLIDWLMEWLVDGLIDWSKGRCRWTDGLMFVRQVYVALLSCVSSEARSTSGHVLRSGTLGKHRHLCCSGKWVWWKGRNVPCQVSER